MSVAKDGSLMTFNCKFGFAGCSFKANKKNLQEHEVECLFMTSECPHRSNGCAVIVPSVDLENHKRWCRFQNMPCIVRNCIAEVVVKELPEHMQQVHKYVTVLPGGGPHEVFFRLDPTELKDEPVEGSLACAPVCLMFDTSHHFYLHLTRYRSGRWVAFVTSNGLRRDGFRASITAVDADGDLALAYRGPVNGFATSTAHGEAEDVLGLSIPNRVLREELVKTEGDDSGTVEIRVTVDNVDPEVNAAAERQIYEIRPRLEAEIREAERAGEMVEVDRKKAILETEKMVEKEKKRKKSKSPIVGGIVEAWSTDLGDENATPVSKKKRKRSSPPGSKRKQPESERKQCRRSSLVPSKPGELRRCRRCGEVFDDRQKLRNHMSDHFASEMLKELPNQHPLTCPLCQGVKRDKINLRRHYAFGHKKILDYCTERELEGDLVSMGGQIELKMPHSPQMAEEETVAED